MVYMVYMCVLTCTTNELNSPPICLSTALPHISHPSLILMQVPIGVCVLVCVCVSVCLCVCV
jgi:hypothetical protein